jgi:hypothetical protein
VFMRKGQLEGHGGYQSCSFVAELDLDLWCLDGVLHY